MLSKILNQNNLFNTKRISVLNWNYIETNVKYKDASIESVLNIMTPNVTKTLPDGWQNLNTLDKAKTWIAERKSDSNFYVITLTETNEIIGFIFLYEDHQVKKTYNIRLGYLLSESIWGKGIGSELIKGLLEWGAKTKIITSISGGVEKDNIGSIKVLEKNGFYKSNEELPENMLLYQFDFE